jgi:hypothetical protein
LKTEKQLEFYLNRDFLKWTNSFARKSVLWIKEKDALLSDVVKGKEERGRSRSRDQSEKAEPRCCGASPTQYGHQLDSFTHV